MSALHSKILDAAERLFDEAKTAYIDNKVSKNNKSIGQLRKILRPEYVSEFLCNRGIGTFRYLSNLLVVLCGNRDAQPMVNSGSPY